eukprot:TRINITY_DN28589_c0_g1_i1.p3 TRINITY_DN28589_c0_g1~~TRINITY_DN28589_c0_g1_i1.p3  ORF type:complete len:55 (+),score=7.95 TRINITY_DN28589_c0_g1_i1:1-165(+)
MEERRVNVAKSLHIGNAGAFRNQLLFGLGDFGGFDRLEVFDEILADRLQVFSLR